MSALIINLENAPGKRFFPPTQTRSGTPTTHVYSILTFLVTHIIILTTHTMSVFSARLYTAEVGLSFFFLIPSVWCRACNGKFVKWKLIAEAVRWMSSLDRRSIVSFKNWSICRNYELREICRVPHLSLWHNLKKKLITVVVPRFTNPLCFIVYSYLLLHLRGSQSHLIQSFMWEMRKQKAIASPRVTTSSKRLPQTGHWGSPWTLTTCCMIQKLESQLVRGQLHLYA